jgi:5-formyltetrahydrofolate cyclo-ligase
MLRDAERVAAYVAVGTEPPTAATLARCDELGRPVLLPVLLPDGDLDWAGSGDLRAATRGLLEPVSPRLGKEAIAGCDVVLVPALAVDSSGSRLGRGGGSYDRALARATGLTIAVVYDDELLDDVPAESHDVRVAAVVTPSRGLIRLVAAD